MKVKIINHKSLIDVLKSKEMLHCIQHDKSKACHPERSEESQAFADVHVREYAKTNTDKMVE